MAEEGWVDGATTDQSIMPRLSARDVVPRKVRAMELA